jgi:hypothetical protein
MTFHATDLHDQPLVHANYRNDATNGLNDRQSAKNPSTRLPLQLLITSTIVSLSGSFHFGYQQTIGNSASHVFVHIFRQQLDHVDRSVKV